MNNRIKAAFDSIHAEEALKQHTREFLSERIQRTNRRRSPVRVKLAAACACLVLLLAGGYSFFAPVSAISVDVNPSVELGINLFDRVVSAVGYNEDGTALIDSLDLKYQDYPSALEKLMTSDRMSYYLENDGLVSITVLGPTEEKSEKMLEVLSVRGYGSTPNVVCHSGVRGDVEAAHKAGFSFGKYRAFLELHALDSTVTEEEARRMTMRQIRDRMDACSSGLPGEENAGGGPGRHGISGGASCCKQERLPCP